MASQRILYAREVVDADGTATVDTSTVWDLSKAPDPEDGSGSALRAEFEEDEWQEYVMESLTVPNSAPPRLSVTYGGEMRMFLHPLGNVKPLLENVLWNVFPGGNDPALTPGRMERRLAIKSLVSSDAPQVFKGAMLSELTIELVRAGPTSPPTFQTSAFVTALDYLLTDEADKYFDTADIPEIEGSVPAISFVLHVRFTNLTTGKKVRADFQSPNAFSIYFRPDLREIRGIGKQGPYGFRLGSAPFECGGTFRYLLSGETDEILQYFIKQDVYELEITAVEGNRIALQYDFRIPRAMFRQAWVAPPGADSPDGNYYTTIEWIAVQDQDVENDLVEIRTPL